MTITIINTLHLATMRYQCDSFASNNNDNIQSLSNSKNAIESTPYSDNNYYNKTDFFVSKHFEIKNDNIK